jgi:transcriptional regulator with XRE-family HTH domain
MEITPEQIRAARALLRIEQDELASRANVSVVTIRRLEAADAQRASRATRDEVRQVLEQAGAEFIEGGVRRRRIVRPDAAVRFEALRAISHRSAERMQDR